MADNNVVELPQGVSEDSSRGTIAAPQAVPELSDYSICDRQFMDDVTQLKALRSYMIRQAKIAEGWKIELGDLNLLRFDATGRFPTQDEWAALEDRSSVLYRHLPEQDRRRFLYGQIPHFVIKTAGSLGAVALTSLVGAVAATVFSGIIRFGDTPQSQFVAQITYQAVSLLTFIFFLAWVAALGGIGSIAFIGMNALAVQEDVTFDITNEKLIGLRVMLGALFAVVLTLPFGFTPFNSFVYDLFRGNDTPSALALKSVLLLLPFILGFSTTLVIMILNQFVEAVQSFFGKRSSPSPTAAPRAAPPPAGPTQSAN